MSFVAYSAPDCSAYLLFAACVCAYVCACVCVLISPVGLTLDYNLGDCLCPNAEQEHSETLSPKPQRLERGQRPPFQLRRPSAHRGLSRAQHKGDGEGGRRGPQPPSLGSHL